MWKTSILDFLREKKGDLVFYQLVLLIFALSSLVLSERGAYVAYMVLVGLTLEGAYLFIAYLFWKKRREALVLWLYREGASLGDLPPYWQGDPALKRLVDLREEMRGQVSQAKERDQSLKEYITLWAHQIKSPLFALRLLLREAQPDIGQANKELFEMEEYIQNILGYIRLESDSTDYIFSWQSLDDLVRASIRKYSFLCIGRGNQMDFRPSGRGVLTDGKWFSFMVDQVLSNAIKYTKAGRISIYMEGDRLCIEDTGIGIREEDLPRIFDRGYTGYNGRLESKSTGLGLNLVKAIGGNLGIDIGARSKVGEGTCIWMDLKKKEFPQ